MPAVAAPAKVLVTGASGFLAVWVIRTLLERGLNVVGTVRSNPKGDYLKDLYKEHGDRFSYVIVEDIEAEGAFDEAVKDVDAVAHTASPFHMHADEPDEIIGPAVNGTVGVLRSIKAHGKNVKRVVVTSSLAAIEVPRDPPSVFTEADWNDFSEDIIKKEGRNATASHKYRASKTLAERAAWDFVKENHGLGFDLVTVNPPFIYGPPIHDVPKLESLNTSLASFHSVLMTKDSPLPDEKLAESRGNWVDVRDVAAIHVEALLQEVAGGERFCAVSSAFTWQDFLDGLNDAGVPDIRKGIPGAGKNTPHNAQSGEKSIRVLGIKYKTIGESAKDTVEALRSRGW